MDIIVTIHRVLKILELAFSVKDVDVKIILIW